MAADLSATYKASSTSGGRACRDHNPYAQTVVREYLFIRPLETLVIFDRVQGGANYTAGNVNPVVAAKDVVKTVYVHSPVTPAINGNTATWDNQGQRLKGWFFGPAAASLSNVNEGNFTGHLTSPANFYQQRLEFSNAADVAAGTATAQSYMVSVLRAGDASGWQDFTTATLTDNGLSYTLTLNHPTAGSAVWTVAKGATSSGGEFGYAASGVPSTFPLTTTVNAPAVTNAGVVWPSLTIATSALAPGEQFTGYSVGLTASMGQPPYQWSLKFGELPKGLALSAGGLISGIPLEAGAAAFEVQVVDASSATSSAPLTLVIGSVPASLSIALAAAGPDALLLRLSRSPGQQAWNTAACVVEAWPEDGGGPSVLSDLGGAGTRQMLVTGLAANRTYYLRAACGPVSGWKKVATLAAAGGLQAIPFVGWPRVAGAASMAIDSGSAPNALTQTVIAQCNPSCRAEVSVPAGQAVYFRRRWLGSGGATLRTGGISVLLAPVP
jgi:hypothetical protein